MFSKRPPVVGGVQAVFRGRPGRRRGHARLPCGPVRTRPRRGQRKTADHRRQTRRKSRTGEWPYERVRRTRARGGERTRFG